MRKYYTMPQIGVIAFQAGERLMWGLENSLDKAEHSAPERHPASLREQW
ncbi:MAG: hypothetical protein IJT35_05405 [Paludibacteraceae bacterium]|nr:hypothetical protein [Paludibacteraceae bacterium]